MRIKVKALNINHQVREAEARGRGNHRTEPRRLGRILEIFAGFSWQVLIQHGGSE